MPIKVCQSPIFCFVQPTTEKAQKSYRSSHLKSWYQRILFLFAFNHWWIVSAFIRRHILSFLLSFPQKKSALLFPNSRWNWPLVSLSLLLSFEVVTKGENKKPSFLHCHRKVNWAAWGQFALISRWELLIVWFTTCGLKPEEDCQPPAVKYCWVSDGCVCVRKYPCVCVWGRDCTVCVWVLRKYGFCMFERVYVCGTLSLTLKAECAAM